MGRALKPNEVFDNFDPATAQIISMVEALRIFAKSAELPDLEKRLAELAVSSAGGFQKGRSNVFSSEPTARDLISSVKLATRSHHKMLLQVMERPGERLDRLMLLMEDTGNIYIDYSELIGRKLFPKSTRGRPSV